jgi:hypothetical protein
MQESSCVLYYLPGSHVHASTHAQSCTVESTKRSVFLVLLPAVCFLPISEVMVLKKERSIFHLHSRPRLSEGTWAEVIRGKRQLPARHPTSLRPPTHASNTILRPDEATLHFIPHPHSPWWLPPLMVIPDQDDEDQPSFCSNSCSVLRVLFCTLAFHRCVVAAHGVKQYRVIGPLPSDAHISACRSARKTWLYVGFLVVASPVTLPTWFILPSSTPEYVGKRVGGLDCLLPCCHQTHA